MTRSRVLWVAFAAAIAAGGLVLPASAARPGVGDHTLTTAHFMVHYHTDMLAGEPATDYSTQTEAGDIAAYAEQAYATYVSWGYAAPRRGQTGTSTSMSKTSPCLRRRDPSRAGTPAGRPGAPPTSRWPRRPSSRDSRPLTASRWRTKSDRSSPRTSSTRSSSASGRRRPAATTGSSTAPERGRRSTR